VITWLKKITTRIDDKVARLSIVTANPGMNAENPLDVGWANFVQDKNPAWLKELTRNACWRFVQHSRAGVPATGSDSQS
jgi:hypothetical protein